MQPKKIPRSMIVLSIVLASVLLFAFSSYVSSANTPSAAFTSQLTYNLDLDTPSFNYSLDKFNTTQNSAQIDFISGGYSLLYFVVPKESVVSSVYFNLTGSVKPVKNRVGTLDANNNALSGSISALSIGELVSSSSGKEIGITSLETNSQYNTSFIADTEGTVIWGRRAATEPYPSNDCKIADFSSANSGNEFVVAGSDEIRVYNSAGGLLWTYDNTGGHTLKSVDVGNLRDDYAGNEMVYADDVGNIVILRYNVDTPVCTFSSGYETNSIVIADIDGDSNNEIIAGTSGFYVYVVNSTCQKEDELYIDNYKINSIDIGNISVDSGQDIIVGAKHNLTDAGRYILLDSSLGQVWSKDYSTNILSVKIGEFDSEQNGPEILVGTSDHYLHIVNSTGDAYWSYLADAEVTAIEVSNLLTDDSGSNTNEVILGSLGGTRNLHILNYDSFPTNITLDVGLDDVLEWNYDEGDGRLRNNTLVQNGALLSSINDYIQNHCSSSDLCVVPINVTSDVKGILDVNFNIVYEYDASGIVSYEQVKYWSITDNLLVNESVVSHPYNVTFTEPAINMQVKYISVDPSATSCGFEEVDTYGVTTIGGTKYCDISGRVAGTYTASASVTAGEIFWDNTMPAEVPVTMTASPGYLTYGANNYYWRKNITITALNPYTDQTFDRVLATATINDSVGAVKGGVFLMVNWSGVECDLLESFNPAAATSQSTCDTANPNTLVWCGGYPFWVCKKDTGGTSGITDYVKWIQPEFGPNATVLYQVGGSPNLMPVLSNINVTPSKNIWGSYFNYTVDVYDDEGDFVNISLYTYSALDGSWVRRQTKNITDSGKVWFYLPNYKNMTGGYNKYGFLYGDNNIGDLIPIHVPEYSSNSTGPNVTKHEFVLYHSTGNDTNAVRDGNSTSLSIRINDTSVGQFISEPGVTCTFSVTRNQHTYTTAYTTLVNSSGYCNYLFAPNSSYGVGTQYWKIAVDSRYYYAPHNISNWTVHVMGKLNLSLVSPAAYDIIGRNSASTFQAHLINQYGSSVDSGTIDTSAYSCSWYFNNTYINTSSIDSNGYCAYNFTPGCDYPLLTDYPLTVLLNYTVAPYNYTVDGGTSSTIVTLYDNLTISISSPSDSSRYFKGTSITLGSVIDDSCSTTSQNARNISWYVGLDDIIVNINETYGILRNNTPIVIDGVDLETANKNLSLWLANSTKVTCDGVVVPNNVLYLSGDHLQTSSQISFLLNITPHMNTTCIITSNESGVSGNFTTSYIRNGGFEGATRQHWSGDGVIVSEEGDKGNYSLKLEGYDENQTVTQTIPPLTSQSVKLWYRLGGTYKRNGLSPRLYLGNYSCTIPVVFADGVTENADTDWRTTTCTNSQLLGKTNITINLYPETAGNSSLYIDHLCLLGANGQCMTEDSGNPLTITPITKRLLSASTSTGATWSVPLTESVGPKRITAIARGSNYYSASAGSSIDIYGYMNISDFTYSSTDCEGWSCFKGAQVSLDCMIVDANTTNALENVSVQFYRNSTLLNTESIYTDDTGYATYSWNTSSLTSGHYAISCNITDASKVYYNATSPSSELTIVNIFTDTTTGELLFTSGSNYYDSISITAENITKNLPRVVNVPIFINNTGDTIMSSPRVIGYNSSNITVFAGRYLALPAGGNVSGYINVSVPVNAPSGIRTLNVSLRWTNNATPFTNQVITVNITNTTYLNIYEAGPINYDIPYGGTRAVGNFTIEAYGNTPLEDINITLSGYDYADMLNWTISLSDNNFDINRYGNRTIIVTVSVPSNSSLMGQNFQVGIFAEAEGSLCIYSYDSCIDSILLNLSVIDQDWHVTPLEGISKTVGLGGNDDTGSFDDGLVIRNLENYTLSLNISIINETDYLRYLDVNYYFNNSATALSEDNQTFEIPPYSSATINITYDISNATVASETLFNISFINLVESGVPESAIRPVDFTISSLNIDIISPTVSDPSTDIIPGNMLNFTLNVTREGIVHSTTVNTTFEINVSRVDCPIDTILFNVSGDDLWHINCTAPVIPGNPINNSVSMKVDYISGSTLLTYTHRQSNLIIYRDITNPSVNRITLNGIRLSPTTEANLRYEDSVPYVYIVLNITDNVEVTNASLELTDPLGTRTPLTLNQSNVTASLWYANYNNTLNIIGDYRLDILATDGLVNHTTNYTAWFDVYRTIRFTDDFTDALGNPISAQFDLYKPDTTWVMHRFSTASNGNYDWNVHKRVYDLKVTALSQIVTFNNFDMNSSAVNKTGSYNPSTLTDAIRVHLIPNATTQNASNIDLPSSAENLLMAFIIDTQGMNYTDATVTMNYADALTTDWRTSNSESDIRVFYCSDWNRTRFVCESGEFLEFNNSAEPDVSDDTITFTTTHNSAYALAKWCGGICNPTSDGSGETGSSSGGGSGAGAGTGDDSAVCGNGACESGETEENCPSDCSYHVCGNGICEPTENSENCALDCYDEPFDYETDFNFMDLEIERGRNMTHALTITNNQEDDMNFTLTLSGDIGEFIRISDPSFMLSPNKTKNVIISLSALPDTELGTYSGSINIMAGSTLKKVPVKVRIVASSYATGDISEVSVKIMTKKVVPSETLRFNVIIDAPTLKGTLPVNVRYTIKDPRTETVLKTVEKSYNITESTTLPESITLSDIESLPNGEYYLSVEVDYGKVLSDTDTFEVVQSFFATTRGRIAMGSILMVILAYLLYLGYNKYKIWRQSKARYVFPMDYDKLPDAINPFNIGVIAETKHPALYNPNDLTTHALVTGSTGAGKSVAASILIEEALKQKIPVIVFDPTAQWTGFVRPCKDNNLLKYYPDFGMNPEDARPFSGMIYEVTDPHVKIDIKKYMNPGEITVFTLNRLKPGEYDQAVEAIIDTIFQITWEESPDLKMIVVFDEVHRLLEKYGGKGGYVALEKACREFRKWGIGMLMSSQVYSDFKEAIQGNILTEIQLNTKSLSDISKIKEKYGEVYSEKISRQGIGVGMIQNPRYNDGKPWFIHFRPTLHSPHKITDEELKQYNEYAEKLTKIEKSIEKLKASGTNVMDFELEFKLASSKLKQGHFKMAEIYIQSLMNRKVISDNFS